MSDRIEVVKKRTWIPSEVEYLNNPRNNTINAIIKYNGEPTRLRAAMLVIKDGDKILLCDDEENPGAFDIPGGGLEPGETPAEAAEREVKEEVLMNVYNVQDTGIDFARCCDEVKDWVIEEVPEEQYWLNFYTCLCIGNYAGEYEGNVDEADKDPNMLSTAAFYDIDEAIQDPSFKPVWKEILYQYGYISKQKLQEEKRTTLISKSRNGAKYKDTSRGKNRFARKKYSKVANAVKQYNKIDMNNLFKKDILQVGIPVVGETDNYLVTIKMEGVIAEIQRNIKSNQNKLEFRTIIQALTKVFNSSDIYVNCTCPDFKYNFEHWSVVHNYGTTDSAHDPGPGKGIANPANDKGIGCKHVLLVLANGDWLMKVSSVINNYVHYLEEKMTKQFLLLIFPKLYGVPADEAIENDLFDDEEFLKNSNGLIDAINDYGRNRGKIKKGSNKNPAMKKQNTAVNNKPQEEQEQEEK